MQRSFVLKTAGGWAGVEREGYVPDAPATKVVRHTLVGGRRGDGAEAGPKLEVRYFEVPPGAVTRLEKHEHEHYVIVGEGHAHAIVGESVRVVGPHDVVYIAPLEPHQFVNRGDRPFGFFCTVEGLRDFSQRLSPEELARLEASPAGAFIDPHGAPPPRAALAAEAAQADATL
jgi:quercetin dioxygenase-like cupin family protein